MLNVSQHHYVVREQENEGHRTKSKYSDYKNVMR
jgi:hypothetical protein